MNESRPIVRRVVSRVARTIFDPEQFLSASFASSVSAKYIPLPRDHDVAIDENVPADGRGDLPLPPQELWAGYALTADGYLECGRTDVSTMLRLLTQAHGATPPLKRVLDLGCAAGRMLRFVPRDESSEHWGIDISAEHIAWCQANLSPPMLFATGTTAPHVPFEDRTFDLIYCGSVFTHISELAEAWLLELRRILRPGGYAYVTIHSRHTLDLLLTKYRTVPHSRSLRRRSGARPMRIVRRPGPGRPSSSATTPTPRCSSTQASSRAVGAASCRFCFLRKRRTTIRRPS